MRGEAELGTSRSTARSARLSHLACRGTLLGAFALGLAASAACRREETRPITSSAAPGPVERTAPSAMLVPGVSASSLTNGPAAPETPPATCEAKASEVVNELPEVRRATAEAMKDAEQSDGGARFGGVGPTDDGEGGITFSLGVHTDERFEARVVASVTKDGALTVTIFGSDVAVPEAALRAVREACRH